MYLSYYQATAVSLPVSELFLINRNWYPIEISRSIFSPSFRAFSSEDTEANPTWSAGREIQC